MRPVLLILASVAIGSMVVCLAKESLVGESVFVIAGFVTTLSFHGLVSFSLRRSQARVEAVWLALDLPAWLPWQAEKHRRRGETLAWSGFWVAQITVAWTVISPNQAGRWSGALAFNLAFQIIAFGGEIVALSGQSRLRRNLSAQPLGHNVS